MLLKMVWSKNRTPRKSRKPRTNFIFSNFHEHKHAASFNILFSDSSLFMPPKTRITRWIYHIQVVFLHNNSSILGVWATKIDKFHGKGGWGHFVLNRPLFLGNLDIGHKIRGHYSKLKRAEVFYYFYTNNLMRLRTSSLILKKYGVRIFLIKKIITGQ